MPKGDAGPLGRLGRGVNKSATVIGRQCPAERWFIMEQGWRMLLLCAGTPQALLGVIFLFWESSA